MDWEAQQRYLEYISRVEQSIAVNGHIVQGVFSTQEDPGPGFCYTVGLQDVDWPELIVVGLSMLYGHVILNDLVSACRRRERPPASGEVFTELANLPLRLGPCGPLAVEEYLCYAVGRSLRMGRPAPEALQVILPDRRGLFPDQPGFDHEYMDPRQTCLAPGGRWDYSRENLV